MMNRIALLVSLFFIVSCDDRRDAIELVKSIVTPIDNSITLGKAYDNRRVCLSTSWNSYTDSRDRLIVDYTCSLDVKKINDVVFSYLNNQMNKSISFYDKELNKLNDINVSNVEKINDLTHLMSVLYKINDSGLLDDLYKNISILNSHGDGDKYFDVNSNYDLRVSSIVSSELLTNEIQRTFSVYRDEFNELGRIDMATLLNNVEHSLLNLQAFLVKENVFNNDYRFQNIYNHSYRAYIDEYLNSNSYDLIDTELKTRVSNLESEIKKTDNNKINIEKQKDKIIILSSEIQREFDIVSVNQNIYFSIVNDEPKLFGCEFKVKTNYKEYILKPKYCMDMSYSTDVDKYFYALSDLIYTNDIKNNFLEYVNELQVEYEKDIKNR
ncbi:hypothetical protein O7C57_21280 (plasmid) [Providencia sp. 21OH12SH02B-Prov]|uniref:hypothetical protein n=1 Tax=Providencia sp. 21OH12SH02B-Prov TaxID=3015951 RepID=UPI0022B712B3|nr:hypothetical protein O7C57_21280 [Providencia sp. 21OH12SH02B-Prov]